MHKSVDFTACILLLSFFPAYPLIVHRWVVWFPYVCKFSSFLFGWFTVLYHSGQKGIWYDFSLLKFAMTCKSLSHFQFKDFFLPSSFSQGNLSCQINISLLFKAAISNVGTDYSQSILLTTSQLQTIFTWSWALVPPLSICCCFTNFCLDFRFTQPKVHPMKMSFLSKREFFHSTGPFRHSHTII